jgi:hypothetical protein
MTVTVAAAEEARYPEGTGKEGSETICKSYAESFENRWSRRAGVFYRSPNLTRVRRMARWASQRLRSTVLQLGVVPWPAEYEGVSARWLERVEVQPDLLETFAAVSGGDTHQRHLAERRLIRNGVRANSIAARLDFHYCRFKSGLME